MEGHNPVTFFDGATVVMIIIGVALCGTVCYLCLTQDWQDIILSSLQVFDLHEQWQEKVQTFAYMSGTVNGFFDDFYISFAELASVNTELWPELTWIKTYDNFVAFGEQLYENYSEPQPVYSFRPDQGSILGVYMEARVNH